jgi:aryl-alcohol dehydrogenase-like predicted oxidoreductase
MSQTSDSNRKEIMLKNRATSAGTASFASRHADLPGNFRSVLGLAISSIGAGTYLGEPDEETDQAYEESIRAALRGGINLIDTAVNYRFQRSERTIGKVIAEMVAAGELKREEVVVATKGGYITFDGAVPPNPREWFEEHFVRTGIVSPGDMVEGSHCMTPKYLAAMLEMSRENLGLDTIDIYYVHNPETQLAVVDRKEFVARMGKAFEFLERTATENKIAYYGVATWNGLRAQQTERGWLSLDELLRVAREVAGDEHHFRAIQLPYNLAMPEAATLANQGPPNDKTTPVALAKTFRMAVCASASLLQGRLAQGLPPILAEAFPGLTTDAQRSEQFVRSTPGIDVALVGMKSLEHVEETIDAMKQPPASRDALMKLFRSGKA